MHPLTSSMAMHSLICMWPARFGHCWSSKMAPLHPAAVRTMQTACLQCPAVQHARGLPATLCGVTCSSTSPASCSSTSPAPGSQEVWRTCGTHALLWANKGSRPFPGLAFKRMDTQGNMPLYPQQTQLQPRTHTGGGAPGAAGG